MAILQFVGTGLGLAVLAGVIGVLVVGSIEILLAYLDPKRRIVIRQRTWRENLHKMLN